MILKKKHFENNVGKGENALSSVNGFKFRINDGEELILFSIFQITGLFQFTIRQAIEAEAKFVAVQRLQHYSEVSDIRIVMFSGNLSCITHH